MPFKSEINHSTAVNANIDTIAIDCLDLNLMTPLIPSSSLNCILWIISHPKTSSRLAQSSHVVESFNK